MKIFAKISTSLLIVFCCGTLYASDFEITFETTECNGDTGYSVVNVANIYRIESINCKEGENQQELKQVMINSRSNVSAFDVFTVTTEEAKQIQKQVRHYVDAKRKALESSTSVIIHK